jgi:dolichyl-phosphate-mannose-protein mannosyltransferase
VALTVQEAGTWSHPEDETTVMRLGSRRDRGDAATGLVALVLSVASTTYYLRQGLILAYQDSFSHLEISRRVIVGLTPGLAQLGGVWLPVPQLLQAFFSWNFTLYRTGLAGALVSMICYIASAVLLYRLIRLLCGRRKWPAFAGAMVFAVNVNVLYQQSTSMDELPFYLFTIAAVYYLVRWGETRKPANLLAASVASMLAMGCRYEGWFLGAVYVGCVIVMGIRMRYSWRDIRGLTMISALFGLAVPAGGWLLYSYLIFGSPLNFIDGPDSSAAQMAERKTDIITGSWPLSLKGYGYAVSSDLGLAVLGLAAAGFVVFVVAERFSARSVPVLGLLTVLPFFVYSLEAGDEPISVPQPGGSLLNYRFGLIAAIPAAILIGYLISRLPRGAVLPAALAAVLGMSALSAVTLERHQVVLATEAAQDLWEQRGQIQTSGFLASRTRGLVLLDIVGNERVGFDVVDRTIYDGSKESGRNQWRAVLANPQAFGVQVIVMRMPEQGEPVDAVYAALYTSSRLRAYQLIYSADAYRIYTLKP